MRRDHSRTGKNWLNKMKKPLDQRFDEKVVRDPDGCWIWTGAMMGQGYGHFWVPNRKEMVGAHVYAYERVNGAIPLGYQIDHVCRNRKCVRPDHLEVVTPRENTIRGQAPNTLRHLENRCKRGHDLRLARVRPNGTRECQQCNTIRTRERSLLKKRSEERPFPEWKELVG
jgi:hypothetical protein